MPRQERFWRDDPGDFLEDAAAQALGLCSQTAALIVGEAKSPVAQLLPQDSVLLAEVVDCALLVFVRSSSRPLPSAETGTGRELGASSKRIIAKQ
jgi:hypothetical protein